MRREKAPSDRNPPGPVRGMELEKDGAADVDESRRRAQLQPGGRRRSGGYRCSEGDAAEEEGGEEKREESSRQRVMPPRKSSDGGVYHVRTSLDCAKLPVVKLWCREARAEVAQW